MNASETAHRRPGGAVAFAGGAVAPPVPDALSMLTGAAADLAHGVEPVEYAERIFERLSAIAPIAAYAHFLVAASGSHIVLARCRGFGDAQRARMQRLDWDERICGRVALTRRENVIVDVQESSDPAAEVVRDAGLTAYACYPLLARGRPVGTLSFGSRSVARFSDELLELLRALANLVGVAGERALYDDDRSRLASMVRGSGEPMVGLDASGVIRIWNAAAETVFGYAAGEIVGRHIGALALEGREAQYAELFEPLRSGETVRDFETVGVAKDGRIVELRLTLAPVHGAGGALIGACASLVDVTARNVAQRELRSSESLFRRLFDSSMIGIGFPDSYGAFLDANDYLLRLTGYDRDDVRAGRMRWDAMTPPEQRSLDARGIAEAAANGSCTPYEKEYFRKDGRRVPVMVGYTLLEGSDDRYIAFVLDLSVQRQAQAELDAAHRAARTILESITDAFFAIDADFRITYWNKEAERVLHLAAAEALGHSVWDVFPEARGSMFEDEYRRAIATGEAATFETYFAPHGAWYEVHAYPSDGGLTIYFRDVTERKRSEEALRESERRERERAVELEAVMRATPVAVFVSHDAKGTLVTGNPAAYALARTPRGANLSLRGGPGSPSPYVLHRDGAELAEDDQPLAAAATRNAEVRDTELTVVFDDGEVRHVYGNAVPLRGVDGQVRGAVAGFIDVTELKRAEHALREADRRKDEFIATLAHELRNPLAPLRNALELLRIAGHDPSLRARSQQMMERQVRHMVRLIDDLLDLSRITTGKLRLRRENVELGAVLRNAAESNAPLMEARRHELRIALPDQPTWIAGDSARLVQVVSNLLTNAAKYTEPGGVVSLIGHCEGREALIRVVDTGIGIPADKIESIFEMFAQAHRERGQGDEGLGIGLHLARRLVHLHRGHIEARSPGPGLGSEFVVRLPRVEPEPPSPSPSPPATRVSRLRVLVVDDNVDAAASLATLLELMGHEVASVHDGGAALAAAERHKPDVVLLDLGMPGMNGYEVARELRARPCGAGTRIVALSGWGQEEDKRRSREAGIDQHLTKPVEPEELRTLLAGATGRPEGAAAAVAEPDLAAAPGEASPGRAAGPLDAGRVSPDALAASLQHADAARRRAPAAAAPRRGARE